MLAATVRGEARLIQSEEPGEARSGVGLDFGDDTINSSSLAMPTREEIIASYQGIPETLAFLSEQHGCSDNVATDINDETPQGLFNTIEVCHRRVIHPTLTALKKLEKVTGSYHFDLNGKETTTAVLGVLFPEIFAMEGCQNVDEKFQYKLSDEHHLLRMNRDGVRAVDSNMIEFARGLYEEILMHSLDCGGYTYRFRNDIAKDLLGLILPDPAREETLARIQQESLQLMYRLMNGVGDLPYANELHQALKKANRLTDQD